jgi:hypothetical protein
VVQVNERSANWRLLGGGGLLLGGVLIAVGGVFPLGGWLAAIGILLVGVALFFVAFGETGSNGAVGASTLGKAVLIIAGAAFALLGLFAILALLGIVLPAVLVSVLKIIGLVFLLLSAIAILRRGVAKGFAKWFLFLPAIWGLLVGIDTFTDLDAGFQWLALVWGILLALTGLTYLFNKLNAGRS